MNKKDDMSAFLIEYVTFIIMVLCLLRIVLSVDFIITNTHFPILLSQVRVNDDARL